MAIQRLLRNRHSDRHSPNLGLPARRHKKHHASWRAAAAIAVFAAAGAALTILPERNTTNATYTAYCSGHTTHDRNDVLAIMRDDLGAMAEAASNVNISIKDDFAAINNAFNTLN